MAMNNLGLGFVFRATDMASPVMRKVEGRFKKLDGTTAAAGANMGRAMQGVAVGLGVAAVGAVGLAAGFKAANAYGNFEQGLARVGAVTRATGDQLQALKDRAIQAGIETQFSPDEAIEGLGELGVRGFSAEQSIKALKGTLDFAAGGQLSVAQASSTTASALRVFGMEADQASVAADKLLKISNITALKSSDLELALGNVARGAGPAKQSLDEMLISMGLVRNSGVEASVASSSVSSALLAVAKNKNKFKDMGITIRDANGEFLDFGDIVLNAKAKLDEIPDAVNRVAKTKDLFSKFGLTAYNAMAIQLGNGIRGADGKTRKMGEALGELRREMKASTGTADTFKNALLDTFEGQKTLLSGSMQTLGVTVGESFAGAFRPLIELTISTVNKIIAFLQALPGPVKKVIAGLFMLASAIILITGLAMLLSSAFVFVKATFITMAPMLGTIAVAVGIAAAVILGLVAVFKAVRVGFDENIGGFGDAVKEVFGKVKLYFGAVAQLMSGGNLRGGVLKKLLEPANKGVLRMVQRFAQAKHRVKAFFSGLKEGFQNVIKSAEPTFTALKSAFKSLATAFGFGSTAMELMTSSSGTFQSAGETLGDTVGRVLLVAVDLLTAGIHMLVGAVSIAKVAWEFLKPILMGVGWIFITIVKVFGGIISLFNMFLPVGDSAGFVWNAIGIAIGFALTKMLLFSKAQKAWQLLSGAGRLAGVAVKAAITGVGTAAAGAGMSMMAAGGFVAAAGLAGYAVGSWVDEQLSLSDRIAGTNKHLRMTEEELNKIGQTGKRGAPKVGDMDAVAKQRGMTKSKFIDVRSGELSQEGMSQDRGLTKEVIAARMAEGGGDYMRELSKIEMKKFGISGITSKQDGKLAEGNSQKSDLREAVVGGLDEHATKQRGKRGKMKHTTIVKVGDTEIARQNQEGEAALSAFNFETLAE